MTTTAALAPINHNHVESVAPNEWEDEAFLEELAAAPTNGQNCEQQTKGKGLRNAAAAVRSSFNTLRAASVSPAPKASPSGRRDSTTGSFMGSLLHGLANAVGLHRENSPVRDVSPGPSDASFSRGRRHSLARLSSAALMRTEIQNLSQFGDLRNDSFTSPSCSKLRRRSSLLLPRASDASIGLPVPSPLPGILTADSGDLSRQSTQPPLPIASSRLTCPGELPSPGSSPPGASPHYNAAAVAATAAALATPPPREQPKPVASPFHTPAAAPPPSGDAPGGSGAAAAAAAAAAFSVGGLRARRSSSGVQPQLQGPLMVEIPSLPVALSPHPPPSYPPPQTRPSGGSLSPPASRSVSSDHLPPMMPGSGGAGGLLSVRDRPPTPRGGRTSSSGSPPSALAKVLGSFHLPDIMTSARSVTERRSSVAGGGAGASFTRPADFGMPRSRRNSICSGPSMTGPSGPSVTGPGGAAISASIAKRAAAAAAAAASAATTAAGGGGSCLPSPVAPSGASCSGGAPRMSAAGGAVRAAAASSSKPASQPGGGGGGILQDFQSSLDLDEDKALAAVDAEFDRRFGEPPAEVPGATDCGSPAAAQLPPAPQRPSPSSLPTSAPHPPQPTHQHQHQPHAPLTLPHLPQQPQTPQPPQQQPQQQPQQLLPHKPTDQLVPRAPLSERTTPQNFARRSNGVGDGGACAGGGDAGGGAPIMCRAPRRASCSSTLCLDAGDEPCGDQAMLDTGLLTSSEAISLYERNSNKMRLASIRLSYAEGIVGGPITVGGGGSGGGGRASLDLPAAAALATRGPAVGLASPPLPPPVGRHPAPAPPTAATAAAAAAGGCSA